MLKCPECGADLIVCRAVYAWESCRIKKNGGLYKTHNKTFGTSSGQGEYLSCEECSFRYAFWGDEKRVLEFDEWYENLEGIFED